MIGPYDLKISIRWPLLTFLVNLLRWMRLTGDGDLFLSLREASDEREVLEEVVDDDDEDLVEYDEEEDEDGDDEDELDEDE